MEDDIKLTMFRGDTLAFGFEIDGVTSLDTATFSAWLNAEDDSSKIFEKDLEDGISVVTTGKYRVRVAPADTANVECGRYQYKLKIGANDDVGTPMHGTLVILP